MLASLHGKSSTLMTYALYDHGNFAACEQVQPECENSNAQPWQAPISTYAMESMPLQEIGLATHCCCCWRTLPVRCCLQSTGSSEYLPESYAQQFKRLPRPQ